MFTDTPGFHKPRTLLGTRLNDLVARRGRGRRRRRAWSSTRPRGSVAATRSSTRSRSAPASGLQGSASSNKIDGLHQHDLVPQLAAAAGPGRVRRDRAGLGAARRRASTRCATCSWRACPRGRRCIPIDEVTDQPLEIRLAELVREQALRVTREEVPHSIAVVVDEIEREGDLTKIHATLVVERDSQKGIVIGHGGETLKAIGTAARVQMELLLGHARLPRPAREGAEGVAARSAGALDRLGSVGAAATTTITVPVIDGWIVQRNA